MPTSVLQGSIWSMVGMASSQIALLAANAAAARLLGAETYGAYGLTLTTATMVTVIASAGVVVVAARGVAAIKTHGTGDYTYRHVQGYLIAAVLLSVLIGLALSLSADWFSAQVLRNTQASAYLWAAAGLGVFQTTREVRYSVLAGLQCFRDLAIVRIRSGLVGSALLTIACLSHKVYPAILSAMVAALLSSWLGKRAFDRRLTVQRDRRENAPAKALDVGRKDWKLLLPASAAGLVSAPIIWLCQAIIGGASGGLGAIATITVMSMWLQAIMLVPSNIAQPLLPVMMNSCVISDARHSPSSLYLAGMGVISASVVPVCAAMIVLSSSVLGLYGESFSKQATPFSLLIIATGIQALSIPALIVIQVRGDFWIHFACNLVWAVLFTGYTVAFKADGVLGYARASLIAFSVHSCLVHAWAVFRLRSQWGR